MPTSHPAVTVVIATHRRPEASSRLLRRLAHQTIGTSAFEVVVVDDFSEDATSEVLVELAGRLPYPVRVLQTSANRGPGPARNLGWRAASTPLLAFTDDDCLPDDGWLEAGVSALCMNPRVGLVQGRTEPPDLSELGSDRWEVAIYTPNGSPYFETCNMFYRTEALAQGGGFGEDRSWWGGWYCEDTFGGWRVIDAGWERAFEPNAVVVHGREKRSARWWVEKSLSLHLEVKVARLHPGFRREAFWRPWAPRWHDAAFVAGGLGLAAAVRWPPAAALAVPYAWKRRPSMRSPRFLRECVKVVSIDAARTLGILYGAARYRLAVI